MKFPRLKEFNFTIERNYIVPGTYVGRADLISRELYGNIKYYKPLCYANNINLAYGTRVGIRPLEESIRNEAKLVTFTEEEKAERILNGLDPNGYTEDEIKLFIDIAYENKVPGQYDWNNYGDMFNGYISDIYEGRILLIPTVESCSEWLKLYSTLDV